MPSISVSHPDSLKFRIKGRKALSSSYDEQADILYLWIGKKPSEAISVTSNEGHLVRLDPMTHGIVGFTIFDFCRRLQEADSGGLGLNFTVPSVGETEGEVKASQRLEVVSA